MRDRSDTFQSQFREAAILAETHGMALTKPSEDSYQLRLGKDGWIINIYPRARGGSPRMYHDRNRKGPYLALPASWDLLDAVQAAVTAIAEARA